MFCILISNLVYAQDKELTIPEPDVPKLPDLGDTLNLFSPCNGLDLRIEYIQANTTEIFDAGDNHEAIVKIRVNISNNSSIELPRNRMVPLIIWRNSQLFTHTVLLGGNKVWHLQFEDIVPCGVSIRYKAQILPGLYEEITIPCMINNEATYTYFEEW